MRRILIAEDEAFSRALLRRTLESAGFQVLAVDNGKDALTNLLDVNGPPVAILDKHLPEISGPEICRRVRLDPSLPYRYLLILTASSTDESMKESLLSGADAFLGKPFDVARVIACIEAGFQKVESHNGFKSGEDG